MLEPPLSTRFLLDENMPDSVADFLRSRNYEVLLGREAFAAGTPDVVLAFATETEGLILVTRDRDFNRLQSMLPQGHRRRITNGAGQIILASVSVLQIVPRLQQEWAFIEFAYSESTRERRRFLVRISNTRIDFTRNSPI